MQDFKLFIGRRTLAAMLECSPATVDRLERQGVIPPRRRLGKGRVGWIRDELIERLRSLPSGPNSERTAAARAARRGARGAAPPTKAA